MNLKRMVFFMVSFVVCLGLGACPSSNGKPAIKFPQLFTLSGAVDTGKEPSFLITDDFNADGNLDLVVANSAEHTLSYFKGKGDGSFQEGILLKTGADPICLAAADFNNDRLPDLAVLNYQDQNIFIYLNTGESFRNSGQVLTPGKVPINLTAADFNEDGLPDLAVSLRFHKVVFLWGQGNGNFQEPESHPVKGQPTGLVFGDYNHDQHLDLAIALAGSGNTGVQLFWGLGKGKFEPSPLFRGGGQPLTILNVDANGDGFDDLLTSSNSLHAITFLLNNKDKTFKALRDFSAGEFPKFVATSDFTGDGVADLAVSNSTNDLISVVVGYGDGTFSYPPIQHPVEEYPQGIVVGDFNRDGKLDLAVSCRDKNMITILTKRNLPPGMAKGLPAPGSKPS